MEGKHKVTGRSSRGYYGSIAITLAGWYEAIRPDDYPSYSRIRGMQRIVVRELNISLYISSERKIYIFWMTLKYCLCKFRRDVGDQSKSVDTRFLYFFAHCYSSRLIAYSQQDRRSARKRASREQRYLEAKSLHAPEPPPDFATRHFWDEARGLLAQAIESLDLVSKVYVKLRYIDGLTFRQIAERVGESERTVKRRFSSSYKFDNIIQMIKLQIQANVMKPGNSNIYRAIYILIYENEFSLGEVARLFCMSRDEVKRLHDEMLSHLVSGYVEDAARLAS